MKKRAATVVQDFEMSKRGKAATTDYDETTKRLFPVDVEKDDAACWYSIFVKFFEQHASYIRILPGDHVTAHHLCFAINKCGWFPSAERHGESAMWLKNYMHRIILSEKDEDARINLIKKFFKNIQWIMGKEKEDDEIFELGMLSVAEAKRDSLFDMLRLAAAYRLPLRRINRVSNARLQRCIGDNATDGMLIESITKTRSPEVWRVKMRAFWLHREPELDVNNLTFEAIAHYFQRDSSPAWGAYSIVGFTGPYKGTIFTEFGDHVEEFVMIQERNKPPGHMVDYIFTMPIDIISKLRDMVQKLEECQYCMFNSPKMKLPPNIVRGIMAAMISPFIRGQQEVMVMQDLHGYYPLFDIEARYRTKSLYPRTLEHIVVKNKK